MAIGVHGWNSVNVPSLVMAVFNIVSESVTILYLLTVEENVKDLTDGNKAVLMTDAQVCC